MKILAVDTDTAALAKLISYLKSQYPDAEIDAFCDPLLAIQHGFNNEVHTIYTRSRLKLLNGKELVKLIQSRQKSVVKAHFIEMPANARDYPSRIAKMLKA